MAKNISEMELTELQDYAVALEEKNAAYEAEKVTLTNKIAELTDFNQALQTRNNNLLMKVEKQNNAP